MLSTRFSGRLVTETSTSKNAAAAVGRLAIRPMEITGAFQLIQLHPIPTSSAPDAESGQVIGYTSGSATRHLVALNIRRLLWVLIV